VPQPLHFYLTGVYTRAEARGQGLGLAVVRAAIDGAQQQQRQHNQVMGGGSSVGPVVDVDVYETNTVAIAFYRKCGFEIVGPRPEDEDTESLRPELVMRYRMLP
jgi:ribosomal protein S18 acetylase RimI-like enzyme